jgi:hypothetical protein
MTLCAILFHTAHDCTLHFVPFISVTLFMAWHDTTSIHSINALG